MFSVLYYSYTDSHAVQKACRAWESVAKLTVFCHLIIANNGKLEAVTTNANSAMMKKWLPWNDAIGPMFRILLQP